MKKGLANSKYRIVCFMLLLLSAILFFTGYNLWSFYCEFIYKIEFSFDITYFVDLIVVLISYIFISVYLFKGFESGRKNYLLAIGIIAYIVHCVKEAIYYFMQGRMVQSVTPYIYYMLSYVFFVITFCVLLYGSFKEIKRKIFPVILLVVMILWDIYLLISILLGISRNIYDPFFAVHMFGQVILLISEVLFFIVFILIVIKLKICHNNKHVSVEEQLIFLKRQYENKQISQKEYEEERSKILSRI